MDNNPNPNTKRTESQGRNYFRKWKSNKNNKKINSNRNQINSIEFQSLANRIHRILNFIEYAPEVYGTERVIHIYIHVHIHSHRNSQGIFVWTSSLNLVEFFFVCVCVCTRFFFLLIGASLAHWLVFVVVAKNCCQLLFSCQNGKSTIDMDVLIDSHSN